MADWLKRASIVLAVAGMAAATYWYFEVRQYPLPQHPLRIGFEPNPPVQIRTASGFAGVAVEVVSEAAKRAGVQLRWVETGSSSDEAFRKGLVDLWPLMANLPERRKRIHFTRPWLHSSHSLLLRSDSPSPDGTFTGRIALFRMPVHVRLLRQKFPQAQPVEFPEAKEVVREVCRGTVAAGFLEGRVALNALSEKPSECTSVQLRVQILPDLTLQHSVASTFEAAGAADAIRREIGNMLRDGTFAVTIAKYSYYGLDDNWASYELLEVAERGRWMAWGVGAAGIVLALALWLASFLYQRQRAEAVLRQSEERFRAMFSQAAVGIAQVNPSGEFQLLNDRLCEILGYPRAELLGKPFLDLTYPDDREALVEAHRRLMADEISSWLIDERCIRRDGNIIWLRLFLSVVRDRNGQPKYSIAVAEDVTEKLNAERALRDSERRLALAQSAAHLGTWERDLRTNVIAISKEYASLYGLPPERTQITHEEWISLVHPDDREGVETLIRSSLEQRHAWDLEFRVIWPDGSVHWLLAKGALFFDDSGQPVSRVGVNLDITERKRDEELRAHLAAIVESSDDAIIGITLEGVIMSWNSGAERLYGYSADEILRRPLLLLVPSEYSDDIPQILERLRHGERIEHYETEKIRKDGRRIEVSVTISPVRNNAGAVIGAAAIGRDITERRRAEASLRESQERFRNMADTAPVMIWVMDPDKHFTFFNRTWLDFTGRTMEQELGKAWADCVHPDDLDRCIAIFSSSFDARRSFQKECRMRRYDGKYRWLLDNGRPLYKGGRFAGYIGSCIDISEQKMAHDQLQTSERRLAEAQRLAGVGSWERYLEADAIYWSDEMFRIFGLPIGPPLHFQTFLSYVHPEDREKIIEANHKACSIREPVIVEYRIARPDGKMRFFRSFVEVIGNDPDAPIRMAGATQDVTDLVKAQEHLRASEERLRSAQRLTHVGNWEWDIKTNHVYCSEEIHQIFGRPLPSTPDYSEFLQALQPQDRERLGCMIRDALEGKTGPYFLEFQIVRPDGNVRTIAWVSEVSCDDAGSPVRMFGACQDITDQKCAEAQLRKSLNEIAHLNRVAAMGQLTASLAHELNQPLAAILCNAQAARRFMDRESPDLVQARECLSEIVDDDKRAGSVIHSLRSLLKKGEPQQSFVDLNEIVWDALHMIRNDALLRQVVVEFEPTNGLSPVLGDRVQLYQVVLNLIVNGLEATAEQPQGARWLSVRTLKSNDGGVLLTVQDSGRGIAESDLVRVFEPFFTTKKDGLGVGLSISRSIVQVHGGRIWAENAVGGGAIFSCAWPTAQQAAVATANRS